MHRDRINLSPTALEVLLALSQAPQGARMSGLAAALEIPASQVETALRAMVGVGIATRAPTGHRYLLHEDHPALSELVALAARMTDPDRAIEIVLRSNEGVERALRDDSGYIVSVVADDPVDPVGASELLEMVIPHVTLGRADAPPIEWFDANEFARMLRVAPSLRVRVAAAREVKGRAAGPASSADNRPSRSPTGGVPDATGPALG
jgi:hypothetical protein